MDLLVVCRVRKTWSRKTARRCSTVKASRSGRLLALTREFLGTVPGVLARSQERMTVGGYFEMFGNSWRERRSRQIGEIGVGKLRDDGDEDGCSANGMENPYVQRGARPTLNPQPSTTSTILKLDAPNSKTEVQHCRTRKARAVDESKLSSRSADDGPDGRNGGLMRGSCLMQKSPRGS